MKMADCLPKFSLPGNWTWIPFAFVQKCNWVLTNELSIGLKFTTSRSYLCNCSYPFFHSKNFIEFVQWISIPSGLVKHRSKLLRLQSVWIPEELYKIFPPRQICYNLRLLCEWNINFSLYLNHYTFCLISWPTLIH